MSSSEFLKKVQSDKSVSQSREIMENYLRNTATKPGFSRISGVRGAQALTSESAPLSLTFDSNSSSSRLNSLVLRKNFELSKVIFELQHPEVDPKGRFS